MQIGPPVREFEPKMYAFPTIGLKNGPPGVRKENWQLEKSKTGMGTLLEGRVTYRK